MTAHEHRRDVFDAHTEFHRDKGSKAGRIEHPCLTDDAMGRESEDLEGPLHHRIEGVAHDNNHRVGTGRFDILGDARDDFGVGAQQIVAAHSRFAGDPRSDDDHIAIGCIGIVVRTAQGTIVAHDRRGLHQVERFAFGHVFGLGDIQQDHIPELSCGAPMGAGCPYVSSSNNTDFRSSHARVAFSKFQFVGFDAI